MFNSYKRFPIYNLLFSWSLSFILESYFFGSRACFLSLFLGRYRLFFFSWSKACFLSFYFLVFFHKLSQLNLNPNKIRIIIHFDCQFVNVEDKLRLSFAPFISKFKCIFSLTALICPFVKFQPLRCYVQVLFVCIGVCKPSKFIQIMI